MLKTRAGCIALIWCAGAHATNWVDVSRGQTQTTFVDFDSLKRQGPDLSVWVKIVRDKPELLEGAPKKLFSYFVELAFFNCENETAEVRSATFYDAKGGSLMSGNTSQGVKPVVPDTAFASVLDAVCKQIVINEQLSKDFGEWQKTHPAGAPAN